MIFNSINKWNIIHDIAMLSELSNIITLANMRPQTILEN